MSKDVELCRRRQISSRNKTAVPKLRLVFKVAILTCMSVGKFTTQAAVLWGAIPLETQKRILMNVFCVACRKAVQIINYTGNVKKNGDLFLEGSCAVCGHEIVRTLETSENRNENN